MSSNRKKVLAICGSTRKNSTNEAILNGIAQTYKELMEVTLFTGLVQLPHFIPDTDEEATPASVREFRNQIEKADGIIICTPEYVFSLPGSLKNAIEWTVSTTVFLNKPAALIVASGIGDKAYESLVLIMKTVGVRMGDPGAILIKGTRNKFDSEGIPINSTEKEQIDKLVKAFDAVMEGTD
ncbi:hypothetical protein BH10BAC4_BH10BAC4_26460 [soil metagenome]